MSEEIRTALDPIVANPALDPVDEDRDTVAVRPIDLEEALEPILIDTVLDDLGVAVVDQAPREVDVEP